MSPRLLLEFPRGGFQRLVRNAVLALVLLAAVSAETAHACAVCYGESDAPMAVGMNWGIFSLLGVILSVLGAVAAFFVFLARKSATAPQGPSVTGLFQTAQQK